MPLLISHRFRVGMEASDDRIICQQVYATSDENGFHAHTVFGYPYHHTDGQRNGVIKTVESCYLGDR